MNAHTPTPVEDDKDIEELAAVDFEPWKSGEGLTPEELRRHATRHIENAMAAICVMYRTKAELATAAEKHTEEAMSLFDVIHESAEAFEEVAKICNAASARIMTSIASLAVAEPSA